MCDFSLRHAQNIVQSIDWEQGKWFALHADNHRYLNVSLWAIPNTIVESDTPKKQVRCFHCEEGALTHIANEEQKARGGACVFLYSFAKGPSLAHAENRQSGEIT